ncbi:MAG TPA: PH domain-containing protein [Pseudonocardiaceae bacterium]
MTLVVRPHRLRQIAIPVAVALFAVFLVCAILLPDKYTGVYFTLSDQVSMALIGVLLACGVLLLARPRVRADADGVEVRNLLFGQKVPWDVIGAVTFPDGAPWARLELPEFEYIPLVAIQAFDGGRAVVAIRELRALHRQYHHEGSEA